MDDNTCGLGWNDFYPNISEELEEILCKKCQPIIDAEASFSSGPIYHYTSPEGLLGILKSEGPRLWFTRFDSLNDYSEREHFYDCLREYCERKVRDGKMDSSFSELISNIDPVEVELFAYDQKTNERHDTHIVNYRTEHCEVYLCCFSSNSDSLAMWNYYSKSNRYEGYNIGFVELERACGKEIQLGKTLKIRRVFYQDDEKQQLFDSFILPLNDYFPKASKEEQFEIRMMVREFVETYQFLFKHSSFLHENEIRAILKIPYSCKDKKCFRNSNGYIVPYVEIPVPKDSVVEITIAPMLQKEIAQKNIRELLQTYQYSEQIYVTCSDIPVRF